MQYEGCFGSLMGTMSFKCFVMWTLVSVAQFSRCWRRKRGIAQAPASTGESIHAKDRTNAVCAKSTDRQLCGRVTEHSRRTSKRCECFRASFLMVSCHCKTNSFVEHNAARACDGVCPPRQWSTTCKFAPLASCRAMRCFLFPAIHPLPRSFKMCRRSNIGQVVRTLGRWWHLATAVLPKKVFWGCPQTLHTPVTLPSRCARPFCKTPA